MDRGSSIQIHRMLFLLVRSSQFLNDYYSLQINITN